MQELRRPPKRFGTGTNSIFNYKHLGYIWSKFLDNETMHVSYSFFVRKVELPMVFSFDLRIDFLSHIIFTVF